MKMTKMNLVSSTIHIISDKKALDKLIIMTSESFLWDLLNALLQVYKV